MSKDNSSSIDRELLTIHNQIKDNYKNRSKTEMKQPRFVLNNVYGESQVNVDVQNTSDLKNYLVAYIKNEAKQLNDAKPRFE